MPILKTIETIDGPDIQQIVLQEGDQAVTLLSLGGTTQDWRLNHAGTDIPLVLGYSDPRRYLETQSYHGAIAGRVANRIAGAQFTLDGKNYQLPANEGRNMLHGGRGGLSRKHFSVDLDSANNGVRFTYHSPDGEEGFPGAVDFTYDILLRDGQLIYDLSAKTDRPTPINLAQHNYYNLTGTGDIWSHTLQVTADRFTPIDDELIPTGAVDPVPDWLDYQSGALIEKDPARHTSTDHNLVLAEGLDRSAPIASLHAPNGVKLRMWSEQPGIQMYCCDGLATKRGGHGLLAHQRHHGVCLEPQHFPDAINRPEFAGIIATPDRPYKQRLTLDIVKG